MAVVSLAKQLPIVLISTTSTTMIVSFATKLFVVVATFIATFIAATGTKSALFVKETNSPRHLQSAWLSLAWKLAVPGCFTE